MPRMLKEGRRVRCLVRDTARLEGRAWHDDVEIVAGDVLAPESLQSVMSGVTVAYYLIHSMGAGADFEHRDLTAARNFGNAAKSAGVERIVIWEVSPRHHRGSRNTSARDSRQAMRYEKPAFR